jgi:hypothetical protein
LDSIPKCNITTMQVVASATTTAAKPKAPLFENL